MPGKGLTLIGDRGTKARLRIMSGTNVEAGTVSCGAAARTALGTVTVTGAAFGDAVLVGVPEAQPTSLFIHGEVTAVNTVTVYGLNPTAGALSATAGTYKVFVLKNLR